MERMVPFSSLGAFEPVADCSELRRLSIRGAAVTISAAALSLIFRVGGTVVLARLLTPGDFGVVTMVTTFSLLLVSVGLNGFTEAVIQSEHLDRYTASNLFWINAGAGLLLATGFAAGGSLMATFYKNTLVTNVAIGVSGTIFIQSASCIHLALLKRAMRFAAISANELVALAVYSVVSIALAIAGFGYWSLVVALIANALSLVIGAWYLCRWVPSTPRRDGKTATIIRFAAKVYGQFGVAYCQQNIDNLIVGWRFNTIELGLYKKAYDLFALSASQLTAPVNDVAFATLSRLNQDQDRFRRYLANSLGMVALIGMAASAELTLVGRHVVRLLLGAKWAKSGEIFEMFAPGIGAMLLCSAIGWIHLPLGRPGRWLRWNLIAFVLTVVLFIIALPWGSAAIAAAWSGSYWILVIPGFWYAGRPIGFGIEDFVNATWRYPAAALLAGLTTAWIIRPTSLWPTPLTTGAAVAAILSISTVLGVLYVCAVILLHWGLAPIRQLTGLLMELAPVRKRAKQASQPA